MTMKDDPYAEVASRQPNKRSRPDLESSDDADDYSILAVNQPDSARRYNLTVSFDDTPHKMMVDTGSPTSFIDYATALQMSRNHPSRFQPLSTEEKKDTSLILMEALSNEWAHLSNPFDAGTDSYRTPNSTCSPR